MLKAEIKAEILRDVVEIIQTIVDEVKFNFEEDGLSLKAVDPAHVAMVELNLKKDAFMSYEAKGTELGIALNKIDQFLKLSAPSDKVTLEHVDDENRLILKVNNITQKMPILDTAGMTDPSVPQLDLPINVKILGKHLQTGVKASQNIADHIAISVGKEGFEMFSEEDEDSVKLSISKEELEEIVASEDVRSLFALDYFANMIKSVDSNKVVTVELGKDYPVKLQFEFADGNGHVMFLLAPRIESV